MYRNLERLRAMATSMKITLCGSAKFEKEFKEYNKRLSLAGHVVYSLSVYPSDMGQKNWYNDKEKEMLDKVHKNKILNSDAIYIVAPGGYIGDSTKSEISFAREHNKIIMCAYPLVLDDGYRVARTCPYEGCADPTKLCPCPLCYE